jgi:chemotaxis protein CheX
MSAQEVFALMLGDRLESTKDPVVVDSLDVTSMVGLAGSLYGLLTLRCSSQCAALMAVKMLGAEAPGCKGQLEDAVGEVGNMVAGNFKNKISGISDGCKLSVPTVITGSNYSLCALANDYAMEINLVFHGNPMVFCLQLN